MISFVFPGQGSQQVGMAADLIRDFPVVRDSFEEADEILGFSLSRLCIDGGADELAQTEIAQPAILTMSVGILRTIDQIAGIEPDLVAGHSLGEYSAMVCSGVLDFHCALTIVQERGRLMQEAVPSGQGSMAAILKLDREEVEELCREALVQGEVLAPANYNSSEQTVIAGHSAAVARATSLAKEKGGRAVPLRVSAPFHCPLMQPAASALVEVLEQMRFSPPKIPIVNNVDADICNEVARFPGLLSQQVISPVRWHESMMKFKALGVTHVVEIGPGSVLTGLVRRIDNEMNCMNIGTRDELFSCHRQLSDARNKSLISSGWEKKEEYLISPDGSQILMEGDRIQEIQPTKRSTEVVSTA